MRLIHDCSMPPGQAVNDYSTEEWHQKFARVDDATALVTEGCFVAKVDIQSAYRHVPISKHSQKVTGLKWQFNGKTVYLRDKKLLRFSNGTWYLCRSDVQLRTSGAVISVRWSKTIEFKQKTL